MQQDNLTINQAYAVGEKSMAFLMILNGNIGLTDREIKLTALLSDQYTKFSGQGLNEPFLSEFIFNTDGRKHLMDEMGDKMSSQNLGNVFKALITKGVLAQEGKKFQMNPSLLPKDSVTFNLVEKK